MSSQVISVTEAAAERIKEIMSGAKDDNVKGVRVTVVTGGCAGMAYEMNYIKDQNPGDEIVEDKGVKVYIDPKAVMYLLGTSMDYKKISFHLLLFLIIPTRQSVAVVVNLLKFKLLCEISFLKSKFFIIQ